jgi:adenylyltransferase/sulfurtransferase
MNSLSVAELKQHMDAGDVVTVIDVREQNEHALCSIGGARLIPLGHIESVVNDLPREGLLVMQCHHGGRSAKATQYLMAQGFTNVVNLTGGIHAWATEVDSDVATY